MRQFIAIFFALLIAPQLINAANYTEVYMGGGVAYESATDFDAGLASVVHVGLPIITRGQHRFAVEGEGSYSLVPASIHKSDLTTMSVAAYGVYRLNVTSRLYLKPRMGVLYRSYSLKSDALEIDGSGSEVDLAFSFGGGVHINRSLDVYVDLAMIDQSDLMHFTLGLEYHFVFY
ncbi:MAG: outer membrane beta-barrel protein [Campylobacterota bacterium]|nr:outer membrane beta-barrel protein [Campylobacterota bacterium]